MHAYAWISRSVDMNGYSWDEHGYQWVALRCRSTARFWDPRISWKTIKKPFLGHFPMPAKNHEKTIKKALRRPQKFWKTLKKPSRGHLKPSKKPFLGHFPMLAKNPQKNLKKPSAAPRNFEKPFLKVFWWFFCGIGEGSKRGFFEGFLGNPGIPESGGWSAL